MLYTKKAFTSGGTLKDCLDALNSINEGLNIPRQLVYHYKKRFMQNLSLIQNGLRQLSPELKLPCNSIEKKERARELLVIMDNLDRVDSFSQKFYEITNKTLFTLCNQL
ncbi:hypothetical protein GGQ84_002356 [Desulfitispora alkaliphila]|uniref:hypothetical protein n=1 Tax=Desulfitispora alkaliphila TaxID=622674 RepID=UPI003D2430E0